MWGEGEAVEEFPAFFKEVMAKFPDGRNFVCLSVNSAGWQERLSAVKGLRSGETLMLYLPEVGFEEFWKALKEVEGFDCWRSSLHRTANGGIVAWFRA